MKLSVAAICITTNLFAHTVYGATTRKTARKTSRKLKSKKGPKVPEIGRLMNKAFPMWKVDDKGNRKKTKPCTVDSCKWNPFMLLNGMMGSTLTLVDIQLISMWVILSLVLHPLVGNLTLELRIIVRSVILIKSKRRHVPRL